MMPRLFALGFGLLAVAAPPTIDAQTRPDEVAVRAAVEAYNRAFIGKDLSSLKALLTPDIVRYEHSVRNVGLDDVWENHLRPEVPEFENATAEFSDVRISATADMALVPLESPSRSKAAPVLRPTPIKRRRFFSAWSPPAERSAWRRIPRSPSTSAVE